MTTRRQILRGLTAAAALGVIARPARAAAAEDIYAVPHPGTVRVLHITDTHAQIRPVFFREPSVNIGIGAAQGVPPHLVGRAFLDHFAIRAGGRDAYGYTYLDFDEAAHRYGAMGGFAHVATLLARLRAEAPAGATITLDGGDLMQGSALANATAGAALAELANDLGIDAMTGHWEFTYGQDGLRANIARLHGKFLAQNVYLTEDAAFNGAHCFDASTGRVFQPAQIYPVGGRRVAVIGQAFPYVPIAHPRRFTPDWSFGIHPAELQALASDLRHRERADAVVLLSHNGMDADLKLASVVSGIDVILGGHTHDAIPTPTVVTNPGGRTLVANGGSSGKFVGVLDLDIGAGGVRDIRYRLLPVFSNLLPADAGVAARIDALEAPGRAAAAEVLARADTTLYRRGNFDGPIDRVICDALRHELDAEIALSPGFRWGPSLLAGSPITMGDLMAQTAVTYPDVYVQTMTGAAIKALMEDVCDNLFNPDPFRQQGGDMIRIGGMSYACTPANAMGSRISDLVLADGRTLEAGKSYRVAGWASVSQPQDGTPVWDVVARYLRARGTVAPDTSTRVTLRGVASNPGYAAT